MGKSWTVYIWSCCYCGHGGMNINTTSMCVSCGVARCGNCRMEEMKARGQSFKPSKRPKEGSGRRTVAKTSERQHETSSETAPGENRSSKKTVKTPNLEQKPSPQPRDLAKGPLRVHNPSNSDRNLRGAVDPNISDTETVVSTASSAATLVDPGAVDALARSIMVFQSLGCLWPQLVECCDTKERSIHVIERLLKRYAMDLELISLGMQSSKISESRMCLTAARFVRKSRLRVAHKIWEAQAHDLHNTAGQGNINHASNWKILTQEDVDDEDGPIDDDLAFEKIEESLFDKSPIFSLQANIKLLINLQNPMDHSTIHFFLSPLNTFVWNKISSLYEPSLSPGCTRVRYTCRCGRKLYDDFKELHPGALKKLENLLVSYFCEYPVTLQPGDIEPPATHDRSNRGNILGGWVRRWKQVFEGRLRDARLPQTRRPAEAMELGLCSGGTGSDRAGHNFVLLCLPFMRWARKLHQPHTCNMQSDKAFFLSLRNQYAEACKSRRWMSSESFRRVLSIDFVKFEMYRNALVDIKESPSVPDLEDKQGAEENYSYQPLPAETNPPIGPNLLMHLFKHPEDADVELVIYRKIPKKLRDKLEACPLKGTAVGWGVHFTEGINWFALFTCGCIGFTGALVFAVAWSTARGDIQSGFAIGGFIVTFMLFCLGIARTEIELGT
ncbi:hypothetical protein N8I77_012204 [Diaporthe amygdali]|uniref:Uncharacterized protein n=1 Tax=Phomopsis amygdali TaxID=1214568 RepID=A0AAD9S797_PHOAM|nr:hypothetical protein N8I77_012204 [Diaporthe amygdali]